MEDNEWGTRTPRQNYPSKGHHPYNLTFTTLIICNFPAHQATSHHAALAFIIPILLGFLQIQSMGSQPSSFQTNPITTIASVICIVAYYLLFVASLRLPNYASQLGILMAAFGSLSVASLVSLLLPNSWRCGRYIVYVLILVAGLIQMARKVYDGCIHKSGR